MSRRARHSTAAIVEGAIGGALLIAGFAVGLLARDWDAALWLVSVGAAGVGHAVTFGFGLLERPYFWSTDRGKRHRAP